MQALLFFANCFAQLCLHGWLQSSRWTDQSFLCKFSNVLLSRAYSEVFAHAGPVRLDPFVILETWNLFSRSKGGKKLVRLVCLQWEVSSNWSTDGAHSRPQAQGSNPIFAHKVLCSSLSLVMRACVILYFLVFFVLFLFCFVFFFFVCFFEVTEECRASLLRSLLHLSLFFTFCPTNFLSKATWFINIRQSTPLLFLSLFLHNETLDFFVFCVCYNLEMPFSVEKSKRNPGCLCVFQFASWEFFQQVWSKNQLQPILQRRQRVLVRFRVVVVVSMELLWFGNFPRVSRARFALRGRRSWLALLSSWLLLLVRSSCRGFLQSRSNMHTVTRRGLNWLKICIGCLCPHEHSFFFAVRMKTQVLCGALIFRKAYACMASLGCLSLWLLMPPSRSCQESLSGKNLPWLLFCWQKYAKCSPVWEKV